MQLGLPPEIRHAVRHLTCEQEEPPVRAPADGVAMRAAELERRLSLDEGRESQHTGRDTCGRLISLVCILSWGVRGLLQARVLLLFNSLVRYLVLKQPGRDTHADSTCWFLFSDACVGALLFFHS